MAKLVSTTIEEFNTCSKIFRLTMSSGKQQSVQISGIVKYIPYIGGRKYYVLSPEEVLENRIENRAVVNNINYNLVESFRSDESFTKKIIVTEKKYKKYFSYYNKYEITEVE